MTAHEAPLTWRSILQAVRAYRTALVKGNVVALLAVICAVPVPLFLPLLVDEVLLHQPGVFIATVGPWFPAAWHGPTLFIVAALLITMVLRLFAILFNVWQSRTFSLISKEVVYRIRQRMLDRLSKIALSEYETLGSGAVTSRFVTDLNAVDTLVAEAGVRAPQAGAAPRRPMIEADRLTKTFRVHRKDPGFWGSVRSLVRRETIEKQAVRDVSLRVEEGEIVGLIGANGAGRRPS